MRTNELQSIEEILKGFEKIPTISKEKYAKSKIDHSEDRDNPMFVDIHKKNLDL